MFCVYDGRRCRVSEVVRSAEKGKNVFVAIRQRRAIVNGHVIERRRPASHSRNDILRIHMRLCGSNGTTSV